MSQDIHTFVDSGDQDLWHEYLQAVHDGTWVHNDYMGWMEDQVAQLRKELADLKSKKPDEARS